MSNDKKGFNIDGFIIDSLAKGFTNAVVKCSVAPTTFKHKEKKVCEVTLYNGAKVVDSFNVGGSAEEIKELTDKLSVLRTLGYIDELLIGGTDKWMNVDKIII